jgi:hypothetical protein
MEGSEKSHRGECEKSDLKKNNIFKQILGETKWKKKIVKR